MEKVQYKVSEYALFTPEDPELARKKRKGLKHYLRTQTWMHRYDKKDSGAFETFRVITDRPVQGKVTIHAV